MQTKHLFVLIYNRNKGEVGTIKLLKLSSKMFYQPFQGSSCFVDHFCYLCYMYVMLSCLFIAALWSLAGKGWPLGSLAYACFLRFPLILIFT